MIGTLIISILQMRKIKCTERIGSAEGLKASKDWTPRFQPRHNSRTEFQQTSWVEGKVRLQDQRSPPQGALLPFTHLGVERQYCNFYLYLF